VGGEAGVGGRAALFSLSFTNAFASLAHLEPMAPRLQIHAIFAKLQIIDHQIIAQFEKKRSAITGKKRSNMGGFTR